MVAWMAYAAGAAGLLAAGAFLLEKVSEQTGWPRRFAWLAGLALALLAAALARGGWDRRRVAGEDVCVSRGFGPALVGVALMPWNPAVWWMFLRFRAAVENSGWFLQLPEPRLRR